MKNDFIQEVIKGINNKNKRSDIQLELENHITDKAKYYMDIGYSKARALEMACEDTGNAQDTAVSLNAIHNLKWYEIPENLFCLSFLLLTLVFCNYFSNIFDSRSHAV